MTGEIYRPTKSDRQRLKNIPDKLKVSGDGVFGTLQGEGMTTGSLGIFAPSLL